MQSFQTWCMMAIMMIAPAVARATAAQESPPLETRATAQSYLDAAVSAARWIKSHEIETEHGLTWPVAPLDAKGDAQNLYAGTPGIILFFIELAKMTGDNAWLEDAKRGADDWIAMLNGDVNPQFGRAYGLYDGGFGLAFGLYALRQATGDEKYEHAMNQAVDLLVESLWAQRHWTTHDVISGISGVGLTMLVIWKEQFAGKEPSEFMQAMSFSLISQAQRSEGKAHWVAIPDIEHTYPNFSHGTAGVAYYLACASEIVPEVRQPNMLRATRTLDLAIEGARYLISIAETSDAATCRVPRFPPDEFEEGEEPLYYWSWCHGPPGTARLFHKLHQLTGDDEWRHWRDRFGEAVLRANLSADDSRAQHAGWWNNVGPCCGNVGVAQFALDMYEVTNDDRYLTLARELTTDLLRRATRIDHEGEPAMYWLHAEHRVRPDFLQAQTGYMQGAAGIGLWLLRMHAFETDTDWTLRLPDDPF